MPPTIKPTNGKAINKIGGPQYMTLAQKIGGRRTSESHGEKAKDIRTTPDHKPNRQSVGVSRSA
jgi:hypothetical protein